MQDKDSIQLSVKDDGIGFDTALAVEGIGFKNMKNRAEMEKGTLSVKSAKGEGCELRVALPCIAPIGMTTPCECFTLNDSLLFQ